MNKSKNSFRIDDNFAYINLTPSLCISAMFEHTDSDGNLYLPEWPNDSDDNEQNRYYACEMDWNKADSEKIVTDYENLYEVLAELGKEYDRLKSSLDENKDLLSDAQLKVWNTYIRGIGSVNPTEAQKRVGNNVAAYDVVIRAQRLCKLMSLEAPKVIINHEANLLAQAMVIHSYAKSMKIIDSISQYLSNPLELFSDISTGFIIDS